MWVLAVLPYILGAGLALLAVPLTEDGAPEQAALLLAGLLGALGAYVANCLIAPLLRKPVCTDPGPFCGEVTVSWDDTGVATECNGVRYEARWNVVRGVHESGGVTLLQTDTCEAVVVPDDCFTSEDDRASFLDTARAARRANSSSPH